MQTNEFWVPNLDMSAGRTLDSTEYLDKAAHVDPL